MGDATRAMFEFASTSGGGTLPGQRGNPASFCSGVMFGLVLALDHPDYAASLFRLIEDEVTASVGIAQAHPVAAIRELMRRIPV